VIVVGGETTDPDWSAREALGDTAYRALKAQGYVDSDIEYLSATTVNGIEKLATYNNLEHAITTWGADRTQDVTLYMVGDNNGYNFTLNGTQGLGGVPETINYNRLDGLLDMLQTTLPGKLAVIMESRHAGLYLAGMTTQTGKEENRLRLASNSFGASSIASNGHVSYSKYFWGNVANGARVPVAHLLARRSMLGASGGQQQAWLDSDSDNSSDKYDINRILTYSLGPGILLAGDDPVLTNAGITESNLNGSPMVLDLWLEGVTTTGTINEVWAMVAQPDMDGIGGNDPTLIKVPLLYNAGRYEAMYSDPSPLNGTYAVSFYASDTDGAVSIPLTATATRMDSYEDDDSEGVANNIVIDDPAQHHSFHIVNDEDWVSFTATAGATYTVTANPVGEQADVVLTIIEPTGSIIDPAPIDGVTADDVTAGEAPLGVESYIISSALAGVYKVKVSLDNTGEPNQPSDYRLTVTTNGGGGNTTSISGQVRDPDGNMLTAAYVLAQGVSPTVGSEFTFSDNDSNPAAPDTNGEYTLGVATNGGTYDIVVQKTGYQQTIVSNVFVSAGENKLVSIMMLPDIVEDVDTDGDGIVDSLDNCTFVANDAQYDSDGDNYGNMCDGDLNNDGIVNFFDFGLFKQVFGTTDADADFNGDGIVNFFDFGLFKQMFGTQPGPSGLAP
jgi:hypothetical protein